MRPANIEQVRRAVGLQGSAFNEQVRRAVGLQGSAFNEELHHLIQEVLRRATLPSNLHNLPKVTSDDVLNFTLQYGISLYLVPRGPIASSMLATHDKVAVRRLLGDKRTQILDDCRDVLENCHEVETMAYREFALQAVTALEADLFGPAQALAANLLDALSNMHLEPDLKGAAKRKPGESVADVRGRIDDLNAWQGYVASALGSTFQHYFRVRAT